MNCDSNDDFNDYFNRFCHLAKVHIPIIASVSEHQPTTWFSLFFDLHILVTTFPVGIWFCIRKINDERVFSKFTLNCVLGKCSLKIYMQGV